MPILISVTRLRIRSIFFLPQFLWHASKSTRQVERAGGFLSGKTLVNPGKVFWTLTAWESEAAMNAFRTHAAHRDAMPKLLHWCDEASLVHWTQETPDLPTWINAYERMMATGRTSKVNHPSPAHVENKFPAPVASKMETIMKPRK